MQMLTCAEIAYAYQRGADMIGTWCRAYRNGLARIRSAHITTARSREYQLVAYRKTHPELKVVKAVTGLLKAEEW